MPSAVDILKASQKRNAERVNCASESTDPVSGASSRSDGPGLEPLPPPTGGAQIPADHVAKHLSVTLLGLTVADKSIGMPGAGVAEWLLACVLRNHGDPFQ
eukprot:SAG31_NODE_595_length_13695_cov_11.446896_12_plen_101_part_00